MEFINQAVTVLQTLVVALGACLLYTSGGHRGRTDTGLSGTLHRQHGLLQTAVQGGAGPHLR